MQNSTSATLDIVSDTSVTVFLCGGEWTIYHLPKIASMLKLYSAHTPIKWDMSGVTQIDSAGIALVRLYSEQFEAQGFTTQIVGRTQEHLQLYHLLYSQSTHNIPSQRPKGWLYTLGYKTFNWFHGITAFLHFIGEAFILFLYLLRHPSKIRYRSIMSHIFATGLSALPIVATSAFLIGLVIAFQSLVQLQKFGADIFIVDTIGISLTRELAPLVTAIVVAGRSGSAFTAQIGAMKMTQEIDAMKTMGFDPFIFLVWPRVLALMIVMPLLIFFADIIGIFGGMVVAKAQAGLSYNEFLYRLKGTLALKHYVIGIVKGPFFAFLIAIISTYRGFQISLNTESIGRYTTQSVVNSIFLVIACDALFSILLTELKL